MLWRYADNHTKPHITMLEHLPYFQQHLPRDLSRVNAVIERAVQSEVALISQIGRYIISAGGKRLRPVLTILSGKVLGYDEDPLYALAAMVEFIHFHPAARRCGGRKRGAARPENGKQYVWQRCCRVGGRFSLHPRLPADGVFR